MFSIGQYVICGNKGVCIVENITTLDISGVDRAKKYYILKPMYISASTVYVPVDSVSTMRSVLTMEEAERLIKSIPEIAGLEIKNERFVEQDYKECVKSNRCEELIRLLKTIYFRKQKRLEAGRKETAVDCKYFKIAEDILFGELAVALSIERKDVGNYISRQLSEIRLA